MINKSRLVEKFETYSVFFVSKVLPHIYGYLWSDSVFREFNFTINSDMGNHMKAKKGECNWLD